ncbi:hypothetical protein [Profundibacterium mesophilum]|uniref:DUF4177 domain-containing protein n=1 Tax=Profundibacterium mesophilum KAUST100406-0324 TaxID=1037889 RepID=A0A921NT30_9RHOB|nr:hypothetical protein [Profundibacterium mesophilum]KAF0674973.1 hypothetical protein PMES_02682 [Profundibacterium mesophilum KAUST100406-0324]
MAYYEYKVVPAPRTAPRAKGVKGTENRFAHGLTEVMNTHSAEGWEYHRAESLTCQGRRGLFSRAPSSTQEVLVFRRWVEAPDTVFDFGGRLRERERSATPEELGAELGRGTQSAEPARRAEPRPSSAPAAHGRAPAETGPRLGPAPGNAHVATSPASISPPGKPPAGRTPAITADREPGHAPTLGPARGEDEGGLHRFPGSERS